MGLLDHARGRLLARIGARLQARLDRRVFEAGLARAGQLPGDRLALSAQRDLQSMQQFWSSPISAALMDMPWTPLFLGVIFVFHPMLGWLALAGGAVLVVLALVNQRTSKDPVLRANAANIQSEQMAERLKSEAELLRALGMTDAAFRRWSQARTKALSTSLTSSDMSGAFSVSTKTLRLFLQSAILGLGAWLVLQGELTAGAMIAASIIMGRALAPIEQAIGQWAILTRAREARANLVQLLSLQPPGAPRTALPRPKGVLEADNLTVMLPGHPNPILRGISFRLQPGQALGVIGPSGAGKSTLGRALVGAVPPAGGKIRLDGAELSQYDPDVLGSYIGYLPQNVTLMDATITEIIARLAPQPDPARVVAAAQAADAHEMILKLADGYDTRIAAAGEQLSGGQIQRVGLARALYGNPVLLVLDEPNSNLDNDGSVALNNAIRRLKEAGGSVIVIAHRPAAIQQCDMLMVLEGGQCSAFGPARGGSAQQGQEPHRSRAQTNPRGCDMTDRPDRSGPDSSGPDRSGADTSDGKTPKDTPTAPGTPPADAGGGSELPAFLGAHRALWLGAVTLLVLVGGFGLWSVVTTISGAVIASGQVEVEQNRQIVQHPDGGVVADILVEEGDMVQAGDILLRLDGTLIGSELRIVESQLFEAQARRARLEAERDGLTEMTVPAALRDLAATTPEAAEQLDGQRRLFEARAETLARTVEQLDKRKAQSQSQIDGIDAQAEALTRQLDLVAEELADQQSLLDRGLTQSTRVLTLRREEARLAGQVGELEATRAQAEGRITEIDLQILGLAAQRREEANTQLRDIGNNELQLIQRRGALAEQVARLDIRAPTSGTVLGMQVTTPRAVLRPADPVAYIIPQDRPLVITVQVAPIHIDEVRVGQPVKLMFPAFSMRTTPELFGEVALVSADSLTDQATNAPYYRAEIALSVQEAARLNQDLLPGMPVDAFIQTQERTPLAYLVKPLSDYFMQAFRES